MNVIVIMVDTLRWDHLGYNQQFQVRTPNIDRFATRATKFDRALCASFPTIPIRTDCFTGNVNFPRYGWKRLGDEEVILTELLRDAGYHTGLVLDTTNMISSNFPRGFHDFLRTANPPEDKPSPEDIPFPVPKENIRQEGRQYLRQMADMAHFEHEEDWFVAQTMTTAAQWLEDNARRDNWFLWVDTFEPHEVWHVPDYYVDLYDPGYEGLDYDFPNYGYSDIYTQPELKHLWAHYAGEVTLTDRCIGRLLDEIDLIQLWDSTTVIFLGDHGMYIGEHGRTGKHTVRSDDTWPLYEEVSHIPLLVWTPESSGERVQALAQPCDLMATVLDAAGVEGPDVHGQSWLPLITGERKRNWEVVYSSRHTPTDGEPNSSPSYLTATTEQWTYIAREEGHPAELYETKKDPRQENNVAEQNPEVVDGLQNGIVQFLQQQGATDAYVSMFS